MENEDKKQVSYISAATDLAKAVPIYQDLIQPAAQEIGKALGTTAKTINIALAPISALVWGYDEIKSFIEIEVSKKLKNIPTEDIQQPDPVIVGPLLESLKYCGSKSHLVEMYSTLLATAINSKTRDNAHPAFVEIIKQLTPLDVNIIDLYRNSFPGSPMFPYEYEKLGHGSLNMKDSELNRKLGEEWEEGKEYSYVAKLISTHIDGTALEDNISISLDNLLRLRLIQKNRVMRKQRSAEGEEDSVVISTFQVFYTYSDFGWRFFKACKDSPM